MCPHPQSCSLSALNSALRCVPARNLSPMVHRLLRKPAHSLSGAPSASPTSSCPWGGGETGLEKEPQAWSCRTLEGAPSPTTTHTRIALQASQNTRPACPSWRGTRILGAGASDQAVPGTGQPSQTQSVISMPSKTYPRCHRDNLTQEGSASLRSQRQEEGASSAHTLNSTEN